MNEEGPGPRAADRAFGKEAISFTRDPKLVEGPLLLTYQPSHENEVTGQESRHPENG